MGGEKFLDTAGCDGVRLVPQRGNTARGFLRREELLRVRFKGERTGDFAVGSSVAVILRVGIAAVLSATALGSTGIWMAWPVGWCIGTALSMVFYATAIRKALAEPLAVAEAEGQAAEVRAEAEFAADAEMETL